MAGMSTVGEQLRLARERQQLSVSQVSDLTKIKTEHVRALEAGDYSVFPAPVYVRGFVRSYARLVKQDPALLLSQLEDELSRIPAFRDPASIAGRGSTPLDWIMFQFSKLNWRVALWLLVLGLGVAGGISGWRAWRQRPAGHPLDRLGPGIYRPAGTAPGELLPLPLPTNPAPQRPRP
jgi:cytoskeleton protein RodZ